MNKLIKNIFRLLAVIVVILAVYFVFVVGVIGRGESENNHTQDITVETASATDEVMLEPEPSQEATSFDADAKAYISERVEQIINASVAITNWEDRPKLPLPNSATIEMELIYQHPELPTGCESVALTMLLKYYGFDLEKTTIAKDYLIYSTNFVEGYMGNPFTTGGAGIYSPGLTRTANKYLDAQNSELNAKNVTDSTPEELYRYVSEGTPVVIWNTVYFLQNQPTGLTVKWGEKSYVWDNCEHCMVLTGYDLERNVVIVHDPVQGIIERDAEGFWERYENLGSMALIIR